MLIPACAPRRIQLGASWSPPRSSRPSAFDGSDYALCLKSCVAAGRVDYAALMQQRGALDRALTAIASCGPRSDPAAFPDHAARLAYCINAYNAVILRSILEQIPRPASPGGMIAVPDRVPHSPETAYFFVIDGRDATAADLRREALRLADDDWRVQFVLCDGRAGSPPLFDQPFFADLLKMQMTEALRRALDAPQIVSIDHGEQRLCVWRGLAALRDRLVAGFRRRNGIAEATLLNVLLEHAPQRRRIELNTAIGYTECMLPFDDRLNRTIPQDSR